MSIAIFAGLMLRILNGINKENVMKKAIRTILVTLLAVSILCTSVIVAGCSGDKANSQDTFTVEYNLNYENAPKRTVRVLYGEKVKNWQATRDGYSLNNWFADEACTNAYDFNAGVKKNTVLYASWNQKQGEITVAFDYNYVGSPSAKTVGMDKGSKLSDIKFPTPERLGMNFTGWYKDKACTELWNIEQDVADSDTTLYAGYDIQKNNFKYDAEGNIVYDNVSVNVYLSPTFGLLDEYKAIAEKFNEEYEGKINVNVTDVMLGQASMALRIQQTAEKNRTDPNYYSVADIFTLAGIDYSPSLWYEQASKDIYVDDMMTSIPLAAAVPHIVYNKAILQEVNDGVLPTNFSEFKTLLSKVYDQKNITTISTFREWSFNEATSYAAFIQNGAEYYDFENGQYNCLWNSASGKQNAVTAMNNMYDLFGADSNGTSNRTSDESALIGDVAQGNTFMGLVNFPNDCTSAWSSTEGIGYLPLSNLFTDSDAEEAKYVPGYTLGMAFYKAQSVTINELTAAAVFADYLSKNSYAFATHGWYPLRKSVVESDDFVNSENAVVKALKQTVAPENIKTLAGHFNGKKVFNTLAAYELIHSVLDGEKSEIEKKINDFLYLIDANIY